MVRIDLIYFHFFVLIISSLLRFFLIELFFGNLDMVLHYIKIHIPLVNHFMIERLFTLKTYQGVPRIDDLRKIIIKYYLEEYFGIDIQMKVLDFEF